MSADKKYGYSFPKPEPRPCQACINLYGEDVVYAMWEEQAEAKKAQA